MYKAVFLDYTGTMVKEDEPYTRELLGYFIKNSSISDANMILSIVWKKIKEVEASCYGEGFMLNHAKIDYVIDYLESEYGFSGDRNYVHETWEKIWIYAPLYEDVKPFFERVKCPIYILSNDDKVYLEKSMELKGLKPTGIICAELAHACKPNEKIFTYALSVANLKPEEVLLIGDSIASDITPAQKLGISPILITRGKDVEAEGVRVIKSLSEVEM